MARFRLSPEAQEDIAAILAWTHTEFGAEILRRYEELLVQAMLDLADDPDRPGTLQRPELAKSELMLDSKDGIPVLQVTPDTSMPIERVQLLYSVDPDPQARFWRTATATREGEVWTASLPILSGDLLSLRAYNEKNGKLLGSKSWTGPQPKFHELLWTTGQR